jgi:hypothetical protein
VVKRASGKSLRQFAEEHIFGPLGMKSTHFHDDHTTIVPRRATGYEPGAPGGGFRVAMSGFEQTGDGAVYTTVEDLMLWDQNFYQPKVGGRDLIDKLLVPGKLNDGETLDYASGLFVDRYKEFERVHHGGAWAGYRAELMRFPEQKLSVVCLCNSGSADASGLARGVADIYLGIEQPPPPGVPGAAAVTLDEARLREKAGLYRHARSGGVLWATFADGRLRLEYPGAGSFELAPLSADRFRALEAPVSVEVSFEAPPGARRRMLVSLEGGKPGIYEEAEPASPGPADLPVYAGTYYSEELDTTYTIALDDGALALRVNHAAPVPLRPTTKDAFTSPLGAQFEFRRDARGRVSGFNANAGRIRNVWFARRGRL